MDKKKKSDKNIKNTKAIKINNNSLIYYKNKEEFNTNKIDYHGYHRFYDFYLKPFKYKKFNFLEIGVHKVGSLLMWHDYFKKAKIYGLDKIIRDEFDEIIKDKNIEIIRGNHTRKKDLERLVKKTGKCKIIIDDGSHVPEHQLFNFNYLFKNCLDDDGIFIIEDIETSYWKNGDLYNYPIKAGFEKKNNIVQIFKEICDIVNYPFLLEEIKERIYKKSKIYRVNIDEISMISFGTNCIIIKKKNKLENSLYEKINYKFINFL